MNSYVLFCLKISIKFYSKNEKKKSQPRSKNNFYFDYFISIFESHLNIRSDATVDSLFKKSSVAHGIGRKNNLTEL